MAVGFFDWQIYGPIFADSTMASIFTEDATIANWLMAEQALASAQARIGLVPHEAADAINRLKPDQIDKAELATSTGAVGRPILGLVRQMRRFLPDEASRWVHHGGTTQDIMDTALVLQLRQGLERIDHQLRAYENALRDLAKTGVNMMMPGRTNGQHAQPIPFHHKVSLLADECRRHGQRLAALQDRVLQVQLGGPVGTFSLGDQGTALRKAFATELGLAPGEGAWQSSRDSIAEAALWLSLVAQSVEKVGWTFGNLASSDLGEIRILGAKGESSAMPHKNNPRDAEFAEALGRLARQRALSVVENGRHEHERSGGAWIAEWMLVPEAFLLTSACLQSALALVDHVEPDERRMRENLERSRGLLASEALVRRLEGPLGTDIAHDIVAKAADRVRLGEGCLLDELLADPRLSQSTNRDELQDIITSVYEGSR